MAKRKRITLLLAGSLSLTATASASGDSLQILQQNVEAAYPGSFVFEFGTRSFLVVGPARENSPEALSTACAQVASMANQIVPELSGIVVWNLPEGTKHQCPKIPAPHPKSPNLDDLLRTVRESPDQGP